MPTHTFVLNGSQVAVDCDDDVRLLWVLRDLLGVTGPKYGCGLSICQACTSHIDGQAFNPCAVRVGDLEPDHHVTTIEGLAATFETGDPDALHPVQEVWLDHDVAQCGFCQPGQIMAAVALIREKRAEGEQVSDADLDHLRNVCRCGTYPRVRRAILDAAGIPWTDRLPEPDGVITATDPTDAVSFGAALAPVAGAAVRIRSGRGTAGDLPDQADARQAERRDPDR